MLNSARPKARKAVIVKKGSLNNIMGVQITEYLSSKDEALSPLEELDKNDEMFLPQEINENVMIYSYRTEN